MGSYVLAGFARQFNPLALPKAGYRIGLTSLLLLAGAGTVHDATALNETRTLSFHHTHSGEDLTVTFKRDGRYDEEALKKLNHFLRDWRSQDQTTMDRQLFDILWEVYRDVDGRKPIQIISAYRSPATNSMLRRRSSGVARFSQHTLGHAMDFYIPDVPLEQIRAAGLRLQRGGVGFYPTSGSPFVHLDTGSVRHWPRMTHDQLARIFPDGRTVHLPSNGGPLKGYELARADLDRRGNGSDATTVKMPNLFAALFRGGKSTEEDDEGASAPLKNEKPAPASVAAAKSADPVPTPRAKPVGATIQLASADAQIVAAPKAKAEAKPAAQASADKAEPKLQTPADIINSRGFWDDVPSAANQATPAQVAALRARQMLAATTDPQPTASVTEAFNKAMAYAPAASSPVDRTNIVAASAAIPRPARPARNAGAAATEINTVVAKGAQGQDSVVATSTRLAAAQGNSIWMRVVMLAPSASSAMSTTVLGDTEMTQMRSHFVKPRAAIAMTFSEDPMMGMTCDRFTGSATAQLPTQSFVLRTAALR
ncbi:DUF882 domain-containing protein [Bradyrhizobium sp. CSA112]|nr:DUF882 domain-containing protein [Bradyrhizobium sp. CSA112]